MKRVRPQHWSRWQGMRARCQNKKDRKYSSYGGRGIFVCKEWEVFKVFQEWCLKTYVVGKTLNRIDNDGPYSPENCNWATPHEQALNRRIDTPGCKSRTIARVEGSRMTRVKLFGNPKNRTEKHCPKCKKFLTLLNFKTNKKWQDGFDSLCHPCRKIYDKVYKRKIRSEVCNER